MTRRNAIDKRTIDTQAASIWGDDADRPTTLARRPGPQFVRPEPPATITVRQEPPAPPAWLNGSQFDIAPALTATPGAREQTSAMDRAQALRVRLVPWLVAWSLLSLVVGVVIILVVGDWPAGGLLALLVFAGLTAFTYYKMDHNDYRYSREGTERHRIDAAVDLAQAQMDHDYELRKLALEAYLRHLEGGKDGG